MVPHDERQKKLLCGGCNLNFFLAKEAYAFLIYFNVIQLMSNNRLATKVNMYKELTHNTSIKELFIRQSPGQNGTASKLTKQD